MGEAKKREENKKALFEKEPENFVHLSELICAMKVSDGKISHYVGLNHDQHLVYSLGKIQLEITKAINIIEFQKMQEEEQRNNIIVKPGGNGRININ